MPAGTGSRRSRIVFVAAALGAFLLVASVALAGTAPSLATTSQYKAFVAYVKKLDGMAGQPITGAQKTTLEAELTTKKEATSHKANALFNRASSEAKAETNEEAKAQTAAVRRGEEEALETLKAETAAKLKRTGAGYRAKKERLVAGHRKFEAVTHGKINALRKQKAASADPATKVAIQEQIAALSAKIAVRHEEEKTKKTQLKENFQAQKALLKANASKAQTEIGEAAEAKVEKIEKHWSNVFEEAKAKLNSKRESQLAYLEAKLEKGRADIATMPAAG
jgi:hypothetical protein